MSRNGLPDSVGSVLSHDLPDEATRAAIVALAERVEAEDGAPPLSDDALTHLGSPEVSHVVARSGDRVVGYAQRHGGSAEMAAEPDVIAELLDAVTQPG